MSEPRGHWSISVHPLGTVSVKFWIVAVNAGLPVEPPGTEVSARWSAWRLTTATAATASAVTPATTTVPT